MNEIIFFPALNTLIKSINSIDTTKLNGNTYRTYKNYVK